MNFELKFSSSKGEFVLNVDKVAVLSRSRIPFSYLLANESSITTTDEAAIHELSRVLKTSQITPAGETSRALLVQANDSKWLIYGRLSDSDGTQRLAIKARMIGPSILNNHQQRQLDLGHSAILTKKIRHALDDHVVQSKRRKRSVLAPMEVEAGQDRTIVVSTTRPESKPPKTVKTGTKPAQGGQADLKLAKEKIKKMTVNILSIRGIDKTNAEFKDLYQHTTQAVSFALRKIAYSDEGWQQKAMSMTEEAITMFMSS